MANRRTMRVLTPQAGKGRELCDLLRKELGVPEYTKSFEVRFALDEVISVKCEYDAVERDSDG